MNNKENLQNLFCILNGCLPYEYDVTLPNDHGRTPNILIAKKDSDRIMQISTSRFNDDAFIVSVYDDGDDPDKDGEEYQWDNDSPDFTLDNILTDIKNHI